VDWKFDESKTTSKEELVRLKSKREIQHVHGVAQCTPHPMVSVAGHDIPADDFISPKRSTMRPVSGDEATTFVDDVGEASVPEGGAIRPC
jgi:hypothetical protein